MPRESQTAIQAAPIGEGAWTSQWLTRAVRRSLITGHHVVAGCGLHYVLRNGVVGAEHPAAALQRVLTQDASLLHLPQLEQGVGQGGRSQQRGRVVGAEHPAAALQRVLTQDASPLHL